MATKKRRPPKVKQKKGRFGRIVLYTFFTLLIVGLIAAGAVFQVVRTIIADTEPIQNYDINNLLEENSVIYDSNGNILEKVQDGNVRTIIPYSQIDQDIIDAFISVEDKTFMTHNGFNYVRLVGAVLQGVMKGESPSGTSTITQQYARNMYLVDTRFTKGQAGYVRKVKEAYYTIDIEKQLTKEQILSSYLNTIELGANIKGIQAATQRYFSKDASDVNYIEAAILAGIPKANSRYSPFTIKRNEEVTSEDYVLGDHDDEYTIVFNDQSLDRYKLVITVMYNNGTITEEEKDYALNYDIRTLLVPGVFRNDSISSYFADMVKDDVVDALMAQEGISKDEANRLLYGGGLRIYSTLDTKMQQDLEFAYNTQTFDDKFDADTKRAVVAFQKKYDLGTDGIVGPNTIAKLGELGLLDIEKFTQPVYKEGLAHPEVIFLKEALERDGLLYKRNDAMPTIEVYRDANRNILMLLKDDDDNVVGSRLMLNDYDTIINESNEFVMQPDQYYFDDQNNLVLKSNVTLNFYRSTNSDGSEEINIFIKDAYKSDTSVEKRILGAGKAYAEKVSIQDMYIYAGKTIKVPTQYKSFDGNRNMVIDKRFLDQNPDFYRIAEDNTLLINETFYAMSKTGIIQPQSAMVVIDYHTGQLKAIIGGRNVSGQRIFNRALNPRQPGSAVKPLGVYLPALDKGLTTSTVFDDVPRYDNTGKRWPQNWYDHQEFKYWGIMTMRQALEMSNNVIAVKIAEQIGVDQIIPYLKKLGITTLVESGSVSDVNLSAVALGGMSQGMTTFDITGAYGAIANGGVRNETITFTHVTDKNGNIIIDNTPEQTYVVDQSVAFLMQDMLRTGAVSGLAKTAAIRKNNDGIPIAGKTGTTSSKHDAWFVGYTPYYVAGIWIGNDVQVPLSDGSGIAALFWKKVMTTLHADLPDKSFKSPDEVGLIAMNVDSKSGKIPTQLSLNDPEGSTVIRELFIPGTQPTEQDDTHVSVTYCTESKNLITPFCPESTYMTKVVRLRIDPDYDPLYNLKPGEAPYAIRDAAYTIPRKYYALVSGQAVNPDTGQVESIDYAQYTNDTSSPFCYIHTGVTRNADSTALLLEGISTLLNPDGQRIITQSIIIRTIHKATYAVPAGTRINNAGTIVLSADTANSTAIYPWQIESFEIDPNGPVYTPEPLPIDPPQDETPILDENAPSDE